MATHALPAAPLQRPRVLVVGTAFLSAATFVAFVAMLGVYLLERSSVLATGAKWLPEGASIPLQQPNTMFITLILSVVSMQWAVYAISRNDRVNAYLALGMTFLFGIATITMTTYLWHLMKLDIGEGPQGMLIYTITGAHTAMIVVAMVFLALMAFRALGGQFNALQHDGLTAAALFWYTMVAVYALIWIIIYVTK